MTPRCVRGTVGDSLYRSARAAGVPQARCKPICARWANIDMDSDIRASDTFDFIIAYRRAATGDRQAGQLLYAGIDRDDTPRVS